MEDYCHKIKADNCRGFFAYRFGELPSNRIKTKELDLAKKAFSIFHTVLLVSNVSILSYQCCHMARTEA